MKYLKRPLFWVLAGLLIAACTAAAQNGVFFFLSKVVWFICEPFTLGVLALLAIAVCQLRGQQRWALRGTLALLVLGACVSLLPTADWLLSPLEYRFPPLRDYPAQVTGIVVLGGPEQMQQSERSGMAEFSDGQERLTYALELARRYPTAKVVFTGGYGSMHASTLRGADLAQRFFLAQGLDPQRLLLERESRNTDENARYTQQLVQPTADQHWLLVTSGFHMPRSMGIFRRYGWPNLSAAPCDFRSIGRFALARDMAARNLLDTTIAIREWLGLVAYYLSGKTGGLLPGP